MFRKPKISKRHLLRGEILRIMRIYAASGFSPDTPYTIPRSVLQSAIEELGLVHEEGEMRDAIEYLAGRGYITVEWRPDGSGRYHALALTPDGMLILDGDRSDPGVYISQVD